MKEYLFSVIIPVYNSEKEIERCLKSILQQSFMDLEILIINDGSTDNSKKIIEDYMQKDSRIRLISIENKGVAFVRQLGLKQALGKYLIYVDSDDYLEDDILSKYFNILENSNYEAVCCSFVVEDNNKKRNIYLDTKKDEIDAKDLLHKYLTREFRGALWCWIFSKKIFDQFEFPINCALAEDFTAIIYALTHVKTIGIIHDIGYHYVQNPASLSRGGFTDKHVNHYYNMQSLKKQIIEFCPAFEEDVVWSFAINEMALLTSMCRNKNYNEQIIKEVVAGLKKDFKILIFNHKLPLLYKISTIFICINSKIFMRIYSFLLTTLHFDMNRFNVTLGNKKKKKEL